jgi:RNA polymerase sigma factor (sigma-70 family)
MPRPEHGRTIDDIVTDALSELWLHIDKVTGKDGLLRYALKTARNIAIAYRKEGMAHHVQALTTEPARPDSSFEEIDCAELAERLARRLDGRDRQLFCCAMEGRVSLQELRKDLQLSQEAFRSRVFRLREKLRRALET